MSRRRYPVFIYGDINPYREGSMEKLLAREDMIESEGRRLFASSTHSGSYFLFGKATSKYALFRELYPGENNPTMTYNGRNYLFITDRPNIEEMSKVLNFPNPRKEFLQLFKNGTPVQGTPALTEYYANTMAGNQPTNLLLFEKEK